MESIYSLIQENAKLLERDLTDAEIDVITTAYSKGIGITIKFNSNSNTTNKNVQNQQEFDDSKNSNYIEMLNHLKDTFGSVTEHGIITRYESEKDIVTWVGIEFNGCISDFNTARLVSHLYHNGCYIETRNAKLIGLIIESVTEIDDYLEVDTQTSYVFAPKLFKDLADYRNYIYKMYDNNREKHKTNPFKLTKRKSSMIDFFK